MGAGIRVPPGRSGRSRYDEIEIVFEDQHGSKIELMIQLDRRRAASAAC